MKLHGFGDAGLNLLAKQELVWLTRRLRPPGSTRSMAGPPASVAIGLPLSNDAPSAYFSRPRLARRWRREAARIDLQAHPAGHAMAPQAIPAPKFQDADIELLGNRLERISSPHAIANQFPQGRLWACRGRNDQFSADRERCVPVEPVRICDGARAHVIFPRQ